MGVLADIRDALADVKEVIGGANGLIPVTVRIQKDTVDLSPGQPPNFTPDFLPEYPATDLERVSGFGSQERYGVDSNSLWRFSIVQRSSDESVDTTMFVYVNAPDHREQFAGKIVATDATDAPELIITFDASASTPLGYDRAFPDSIAAEIAAQFGMTAEVSNLSRDIEGTIAAEFGMTATVVIPCEIAAIIAAEFGMTAVVTTGSAEILATIASESAMAAIVLVPAEPVGAIASESAMAAVVLVPAEPTVTIAAEFGMSAIVSTGGAQIVATIASESAMAAIVLVSAELTATLASESAMAAIVLVPAELTATLASESAMTASVSTGENIEFLLGDDGNALFGENGVELYTTG